MTPFLCQEVLPGDSFRISANLFCRLAPMISPIMSNIDIKLEYFFVPCRLLWSKWESFITGGENGDEFPAPPTISVLNSSQNISAPVSSSVLYGNKSLLNYLGVPLTEGMKIVNAPEVSALPLLAYNKIVNDYYIDQNYEKGLSDTFPRLDHVVTGDEDSIISNKGYTSETFDLFYRCFRKDYFTSALPWTQRGPSVVLPFSDSDIPVVNANDVTTYTSQTGIGSQQGRTVVLRPDSVSSVSGNMMYLGSDGNLFPFKVNGSNFKVNLSSASPTINELRKSFAVQRWLEASARGGARLIEQIMSHFGVKSSDSRLQRAEYIGGSSTPVLISQVLQSTPSTQDSPLPLGNMAGHGVSAVNQKSFRYYAEEHGFIIGLLSVVPQTYYYQGLPKMFSRFDKYDYAWPEFGHLGEQPILNQEIYVSDDVADNNEVFGYTPRYAEYKFNYNTLKGDFQETLDQFTTARSFDTVPTMGRSFLSINPQNLNHIFATTQGSYDHFWIEIYNNIKVKRCLPYYGSPSVF